MNRGSRNNCGAMQPTLLPELAQIFSNTGDSANFREMKNTSTTCFTHEAKLIVGYCSMVAASPTETGIHNSWMIAQPVSIETGESTGNDIEWGGCHDSFYKVHPDVRSLISCILLKRSFFGPMKRLDYIGTVGS